MAADPLHLESDEVRFERLYREYAGDVYRYALAIMRNPTDAEDVTQATFLNAWRAFSAGEEPRTPLNWFITIAHNVCRLRFRTNSRRPKEVEFEPALAEAPVDDGPSAGDVLDALAELPLNQRAALVMRELEGRSYGEIATILGVSRSAVETLIFRARRSLRIRRDAIRALGLLPLPQSLASFVRTRGAEAGAVAAVGSGVVAKAVAVIAAGVVATGVARDTVRAEATPTARAARPAQVETLASWAARPLSLLIGGRVVPATSERSGAAKSSAAPADRRANRRGGRLATSDDPEAAPGGSPAPTSPQPDPRAPSADPQQPGGEAPRRTGPGPVANPVPPVVGELVPTAPTLPGLPNLPEPPTIPPVSTPEVPLPDLPTVPPLPPVDLPKVPPPPPVDLPKLPPPPPVDPPELPDVPDLPKLP